MSCICNVTLNEIILGAVIAGVIGLMTSILHTWVTEKRELKKIKTCLKNEIYHNIKLIDKKQIEFKSLLGNGDITRDRSKDEWDKIQQRFDSGYSSLEILLTNAIYSNNNVFKLSDQELTAIRNTQIWMKDYNEELQWLHDMTNKSLNPQFIPMNFSNQKRNSFLITFFQKYMELNVTIKPILKNLKRQWKNPTSLRL